MRHEKAAPSTRLVAGAAFDFDASGLLGSE